MLLLLCAFLLLIVFLLLILLLRAPRLRRIWPGGLRVLRRFVLLFFGLRLLLGFILFFVLLILRVCKDSGSEKHEQNGRTGNSNAFHEFASIAG